jgi:hypothetical protein
MRFVKEKVKELNNVPRIADDIESIRLIIKNYLGVLRDALRGA